MAYPVTLEVNSPEKRSRLTTFFRLLLVIPQVIVVGLLEIGVFFAVIAAWFALLFTGRYPEGLYNFNAGVLRWLARVQCYLFLLADPYPPFSLEDDPSYPVRLLVDPPLAQYSRLKVLLRIFYVIPAYILAYVLNIVLEVVWFIDWIVIVIIGKQPEGIQNLQKFCITWVLRTQSLLLLLTETYPPFDDGPATTTPSAPGGPDPLTAWKADA